MLLTFKSQLVQISNKHAFERRKLSRQSYYYLLITFTGRTFIALRDGQLLKSVKTPVLAAL